MPAEHAIPVITAAFIAVVALASGTTHHWSYSGAEGPSHWGGACGSGKAQSPIDIRAAAASPGNLPALSFQYGPGPMRIVDNGHSVQVDVGGGSTLAVGKDRYSLVQFHFHRPSEEAIDGRRFDMVAHLVHRDAQGHLAVVAVPLEHGPANPLIAILWRNIPREKGKESSPAGTSINPAQLLPADHSYFTYSGSLTTPPCTEGVRWFVLRSPVSVSDGEVAAFARLYPDNARPLQPLNGRDVLASK